MSNAASDMLEKVSAEFESEVTAELGSGRTEALTRLEAVRRETAEAVAKILETSQKQAESVKRQIVGAAELQARNAQLKSLERAVGEAFDRATEEISSRSGAGYEESIANLIVEGIDAVGPKAVIQCSSKDRKTVSSAINKVAHGKATLSATPVETIGGVVLSTPDGSVRFDNTFEARLERMRALLRKEVASALAGAA